MLFHSFLVSKKKRGQHILIFLRCKILVQFYYPYILARECSMSLVACVFLSEVCYALTPFIQLLVSQRNINILLLFGILITLFRVL